MSFFENFSIDRFLFSLQYMWKGMLCIFVVIGVIILFIVAMNKIAASLAKRKKEKDDSTNSN